MDSEKLNNWLQIVGLFGVIGSLIFVGLQLKQSQDIARSQASQIRTWGTVEAYMTRVSSPALNSAEAKLWAGVADTLEPEEIVALYWDYAAVLKMTEDNHLQYRSGFLSEERWTASLEGLKCQYSSFPLYREFGVPGSFTDSFTTILNQEINEAESNQRNCYEYEAGSIWDWADKLKKRAESEKSSAEP